MKIEDIELRPVTARQSSLGTALGCERKWFLQYRWGLGLRGGELKESADLGTVYHKFQQLGLDKIDAVKAWVRAWQERLMLQINKGEDLDGHIARTVSGLTVSCNKAEAMAKAFWEKYPSPSYLKVIGLEVKHKMTLTLPDGTQIELEGTLDKIIQDTRNGNIWLRDHKSTGRPLVLLFNGFPWSGQARLYRILAEDYCKKNNIEGKVTGFILDGILKPGIKLCGKDDKNAKAWNCSVEDAYLVRVKEWYATKESEKPESTIKSQSIMYNEPLVPYELQRDLHKLSSLAGRGANPESYCRDGSRYHCSIYDKACIFESLCSAPISQWPELFKTKYKIIEEKKENENTETDGK